jgi:membrane protein DedA with SNARE-associated domain
LYLAATTSHLSHYGYLGVVVLVSLESLGVPIPGETALIAAAAYAGQTHKLDPWLIFALAGAAAIAGNTAGYFIGRLGGFPLARRYGPKVRLDEHKLKVGRYVLDNQGWKVVFFGRFVSVLRTYIAFMAGTLEMKRRPFFVATVASSVAWAGFYTAAAYNAAGTLKRLSGTVDVVAAAVAVVVVAAGLLFVRSHFKRLGDKAEAAYPGPLE